jgi:hypothetical protein
MDASVTPGTLDDSKGFHETLARVTESGKQAFKKVHKPRKTQKPFGIQKATKQQIQIKEGEVKKLREIDGKCQEILNYFQNLQIFFIIGATALCFSAVVIFASGDETLSLALGLPTLAGGVVMVKLIIEVDALKDGIILYREMGNSMISALDNGPVCKFKKSVDNHNVAQDTWTVQYKNVEYKLEQAHILEYFHRKRMRDLFLTADEVIQLENNFSC